MGVVKRGLEGLPRNSCGLSHRASDLQPADSLAHHLETGSQESAGYPPLWRYDGSFGYFMLWMGNLFIKLSDADCKGHCEQTFFIGLST